MAHGNNLESTTKKGERFVRGQLNFLLSWQVTCIGEQTPCIKCIVCYWKFNVYKLWFIFYFKAYHSLLQLAEARDKFPAFRIPMVIIPATISNNVPGTDLSLGTDTALNVITEVMLC